MHTLEVGQKFERYSILRQLGQGGAGTSYEAQDSRLKSKVVLKLIHPWSELPSSARRQFFRDMQILSALLHPFLTMVLNYGEIAGQLYIVRQYSIYGSLLGNEGRLWFNSPIAVQNAFTYAYQLSQALHLIHSYNYVHGALTFSNILLSKQPGMDDDSRDITPLFLSDAALAQFVRRFGRSQSSMLPMTAAPEQFEGQITPASDQYSLAILLSIWLTGRPPFAGTPADIEQRKRSGAIPALQAELTVEQEDIIRRALSPRQEARYPSILAFTEALMNSLSSAQSQKDRTQMIEINTAREEAVLNSPQQALQQTAKASTEEQESPAEPLPPVEPDISQPRPAPIPEPQPAPNEPSIPPSAPKPEVEPVIIPTPAPDIAQPIPEQTPFPPTTEPPQPSPEREAEQPTQEIARHYTEPLAPLIQTDVVPTPYLIITSSFPREPRKIPLQKDEITLGRAGSSDILLEEDTLTSRHHAHIKREGENYVIYDKRSTHGVIVNEQKLEEGVGHGLKEGDHIQIGEYNLLFSLQLTEDTDEARVEHALL